MIDESKYNVARTESMDDWWGLTAHSVIRGLKKQILRSLEIGMTVDQIAAKVREKTGADESEITPQMIDKAVTEWQREARKKARKKESVRSSRVTEKEATATITTDAGLNTQEGQVTSAQETPSDNIKPVNVEHVDTWHTDENYVVTQGKSHIAVGTKINLPNGKTATITGNEPTKYGTFGREGTKLSYKVDEP